MKIYLFQGTKEYLRYARFSHPGTWTPGILCKSCGQKRYTLRREGFAIDSKNWNSPKIFRVAQYTRSRAMFVSEQGRDIILRHGFTNVRFSEAGIIS